MSALVLTLTDAGRAALVNAAHTGTTPVLMTHVGLSATALSPTPAATALPGEFKRLTTFSGDVVAADTIHVTVRDEGEESYTVRALGLYLADGTLFALYGQASPILEKSAQAMLLLALDVVFADVEAAQLAFGDTNFINPPATTERQGVVELATEDEAKAGQDAVRAVPPRAMKTAVKHWLDDRLGTSAPTGFVKTLLAAADKPAFRGLLDLKSAALQEAASFVFRTEFANSLGPFGYQPLPGGLILQWGEFIDRVDTLTRNRTVTYPIAFPTAALFGGLSKTAGVNAGSGFNSRVNPGLTSAILDWTNTFGDFSAVTLKWWVVGH